MTDLINKKINRYIKIIKRNIVYYNLDVILPLSYKINSRTLTVLTILVAESNPKDKEKFIRLILQLIY